MKIERISEADMARGVISEMQRQGWTVYQEVSTGYGGARADIVGIRGPLSIVVECKVSLSLKLLDQLIWWRARGAANFVVGAFGGGKVGRCVTTLCQSQGIGLWAARPNGIDERVAPRMQRKTSCGLRDYVREEHRSEQYAKAGSCGGGYWTPFRSTCAELERIVRENPGIPLRDALQRIKHHYANQQSATSALPGLIRQGVVQGVRIDDSRPLKLYPQPLASNEAHAPR
jgi:hypothetical protein